MAKAYASAVIDAPIETVWKVVRDFNGLPGWHPAIASSEIEEGRSSAEIGCVRSFYLKDGAHVREQLLALTDSDYALSYNFVKPAFPVTNYVAGIRLLPITDGNRTFAEWTAVFDEAPEDAGKYVEIISTHVFAAGWSALQAKLAG
ncbi:MULTISPECIES: SRPBCC family protein [Ensifer]|uniref:SRPBCC family protein n=1 Tax=Ensifer TaxID=106591 RepID=UPI000DDF1EC0|nr:MULTISPECIES: SRPBCC family protein [Ensifer]MBD9628288.1 SRPBCC family protein [Ensifer sp. ENS06]MDF8357214.1 SRPBCC family protein [Ensifer adhaerens]THA59996.1 SRPBCC family protein [Ensifer adhaerens]